MSGLWEAGVVRRPTHRPVLITDAERSQDDQLRTRQIRYVLMMSVRALCLVLAAVLVTLQVPLLALWVGLCLAGMVLLPWLAVILANDRPPKDRHRLRHHQHTPAQEDPRALPGPPAEGRVIDAE
jgi:Flp pilus assembly protein TadB